MPSVEINQSRPIRAAVPLDASTAALGQRPLCSEATVVDRQRPVGG
jgi:hypothetical protein